MRQKYWAWTKVNTQAVLNAQWATDWQRTKLEIGILSKFHSNFYAVVLYWWRF